ncbi:DUF4974 domain-containing protein [Rudanella paleaurantiibacter]|uniref:DUF4974 domain-containing protein n=1 Tax=Rudanella paleaurantiibacter TaxID=2614655 RepID=A0A7J5TZL9_9BACT|nr:FecR family protein [Rudanella paleaurantiibacter]KAB7730864.1 DUF4974 domain-containing protein [Rudanella paleaurantiibacter]
MNYQSYTVDDFLQDDDFVRWVLRPDAPSDQYWLTVAHCSPEVADTLAQAAERVRQLAETEHQPVDPRIVAEVWSRIEAQTAPRQRVYSLGRSLWVAAAACVVLVGFGVYGWFTRQAPTPSLVIQQQYENKTAKPVWHQLPDSSWVSLAPGSAMKYTESPGTNSRNVRLTGEAYFDVRRDTARPFRVTAGPTLTQVLGTSFWVKMKPAARAVEVDVLSGKVSVGEAERAPAGASKPQSVLLLPNQRALYSTENRTLTTGLVNNPVTLAGAESTQTFTDVPIADIMARLSRLYGIPIQIQGNGLRSCTFTGDLNQISFFQKLQLVCRSVGARYRVEQTVVRIEGGRCNKIVMPGQ